MDMGGVPSPRYRRFRPEGGVVGAIFSRQTDAGALGRNVTCATSEARLTRYHEPMRARKSTATEDFEVELTEDEHGTEMCERWADRLALARMHFARGDLKACQREIDEAARYAALAWEHFFPSP